MGTLRTGVLQSTSAKLLTIKVRFVLNKALNSVRREEISYRFDSCLSRHVSKKLIFYFQQVGFVAVTRRRVIVKSEGMKNAGDSQRQQQD